MRNNTVGTIVISLLVIAAIVLGVGYKYGSFEAFSTIAGVIAAAIVCWLIFGQEKPEHWASEPKEEPDQLAGF